MSRRRGFRDRWLPVVLSAEAKDLNNAAKLVCVALALRMDETGRVTANRQDIAEAVGWATKQRVTDRIKEIRDAGFLDIIGGGKNGRPVTYDAMIPAKYRQSGTPPRGTPGNGWRGTSNGVPAHAAESGPRYPATGYQYARATDTDRELEPAPAGSRASATEHSGTSGSNGSTEGPRRSRLALVQRRSA